MFHSFSGFVPTAMSSVTGQQFSAAFKVSPSHFLLLAFSFMCVP
uniref:Uncharacterized protein n=1 Tax=Arundo donax TaxID=35708 RepID=A0A0A9F1W9_ARUDO